MSDAATLHLVQQLIRLCKGMLTALEQWEKRNAGDVTTQR